MRWLGKLLLLLGVAGLSGCTALPVDGPDYRSISFGASATLASERGSIAIDYALLDINRVVLDNVVNAGPESFFRTFGSSKGPAPVIRVGVGDVLQVTIFESSAGGLFIPAEAGTRPGNFVTFPSQTVDRSGTIVIPYGGEIRAAGRQIPEIQREIESKLANRAIEPQALVTIVEQNATEVAVVGDVVNAANKFRIRQGGERLLDILSRAGGMKFPGYELFVTLQRDNRRATVYFPTLVNTASENIYVAPGDVVYVYREQQKYVAIGALGSSSQTSGVTGQYAFEQERLSLNEAVAKAGGLLDGRANPGQVFLYRIEHRDILQRMGVKLERFPPSQRFIPTVYRANFRDPSSFFFAQSFPMRHKDVIYASNADSVEVSKFLNYVRTITSTVAGVSGDAVLTGDAVKGRHVLGQ
jgi:polysaccharide export outer membrane protein